jgi:DNA-binding CsgD family transcriptional regulator
MRSLENANGWLARSRLQDLAVQAALENISSAAFIISATGAVERSNARARALMESGGGQAVQLLWQALGDPTPSADFEISPLFTYGNVVHYLAVQRAENGTGIDRLAIAVHRWKLTGQEAKVFANLVTGDSNRQIAAKIGCAERTVELHVTHILQRLDVESRNAAIAKFWTQL